MENFQDKIFTLEKENAILKDRINTLKKEYDAILKDRINTLKKEYNNLYIKYINQTATHFNPEDSYRESYE